jgi:hypothetical protein
MNSTMRRRHSYFTAVLFFVALPLVAQTAALTLEDKEQFLQTAEVRNYKTLSEGSTGSLLMTLSDGKLTHQAQYQSIDVYKQIFTTSLGTELNFRDTYKGNIAAYRLSKIMKLGMIPPSIERAHNGSPGAFTWWLDDVLMTEKERFLSKKQPPNVDRWNRQMYIVRVFDELIYNMDRNLGNLVILKNWDVAMIDHTRAFRLQKKLKNPAQLVRCDRVLLQAMKDLDFEELRREIDPFLNQAEIRALLARRDVIVTTFEDRVRQSGEAAVLYDFLSTR